MASDAYRQLLDATIRHLESLHERGVGFVVVKPGTLQGLMAPTPAGVATAPRGSKATTRPTAPIPTPKTAARTKPAIAATPPPPMLVRARPVRNDALRREAFEELRQRALACIRCPNLAATRRNVVFGVGNPGAELLFVGEAPGGEEDRVGEPFVGAAGQLLTKIITAMGYSRDQVYIANILKCRPDTPGQTSGNRKPTPLEMSTCIPYLEEQIELIQPRVMVALGATAIEGLMGKTESGVTRLRGSWLDYRGFPLMPTYHPSYLLRNQALSIKRLVWEDMMAVLERLGRPVSEKQRGYFLKPA